MINSISFKFGMVILFALLIFSSPPSSASTHTATGLHFSKELQINDKFKWTVDQNKKDGENITSGVFRTGAVIEVEIVGDAQIYNHYTLFADRDLADIFDIKIDNSDYNAIFVIDFIIPVIFTYTDGTTANFLETKVEEVIIEDESKIKTTRSIDEGIYKDKIEAFNNSILLFSLNTQFDVKSGVLHLLAIESDNFLLSIIRNYDDRETNSTSDDSSFNVIFSVFGVSIVILIINKNRKNKLQ